MEIGVANRVATGLLVLVLAVAGTADSARAIDHVSFLRDGKPHHVSGKVVVEAEDGGLLLLDAAGVLWALQPDEISERKSDDRTFETFDRKELARQLQQELPAGFRVHNTAHYLICYNTSRAYAQWCGALYERLYGGFHTYWKGKGFELSEPEGPLIALVFDGPKSYASYAQSELGTSTAAIIGYYSLRTNRVMMYDLTRSGSSGAGRMTSAAQINRVLKRPDVERTVATIIHEATHQLAFNCGLHQRYADIPLWVSEGTAVYFETPDLRSSRGWRRIGALNQSRLVKFRKYLKARPSDSLHNLLASDQRFRQTRSAAEAYAEAWALNYYLLKNRSREYVQYLEVLADNEPSIRDTPEKRIELFEKHFGPLAQFDTAFLAYIAKVR